MTQLKYILFTICSSFFSHAQIEITGIVNDSSNNVIEFANVVLTNQNNEFVQGAITGKDGRFQLSATEGNYNLTISFIGYKAFTKAISVTGTTLDLGKIQLELDENKLGEVVIRANKPLIEKKTDRLVFNVENSVSASGGDGMDALSVSPGLRVANDQISIIGRNGVIVMVNDKPINLSGDDLIGYIRNLNADDIKRIEIITNPPAKYDAEGNGGLVNIILKKTKSNSYSGTVSSSLSQSELALYRSGLNLNYQKDRLTITSKFGLTQGKREPFQKYELQYPSYLWVEDLNSTTTYDNLNATVNIDYQASSKVKIGGEYSITNSTPLFDTNNEARIFNLSSQLDSIIRNTSNMDQTRKTNIVNLYSTIDLDTLGRRIDFNVDYLGYRKDINNNFFNSSFFADGTLKPDSFLSANNTSDLSIDIFSSSLDIELPLNWVHLSFGAKITSINNESGVAFFETTTGNPILDPQRTNTFDYEEDTQALYISAKKSLSEKVSVKVGLRGEYTQTEGVSRDLNQTNTNDYFQLFPTVYVNYAFNDYKILGFNYGRRINRPKYNNLNPFQFFTNAYNFAQGNPFLQPFFTNNFELSFIYKNSSYTALYVNHTTDGVDQVTFVSPDSIEQRVIPQNFYNQLDVGVFQWYSFRISNFWNNSVDASVSYTRTNSDISDLVPDVDAWTGSLSTNSTFMLDPDRRYVAELGFKYYLPSIAGSYELSSFYQLNIGFKTHFFNKKLRVSINATDILRTYEQVFTQTVNGIRQENLSYNDVRRVRFALSYSFGEQIRTRRKTKKIKEEQKRI
ncbi:MAG: TonB-dependent receptor [Bacteroidota bacterium]